MRTKNIVLFIVITSFLQCSVNEQYGIAAHKNLISELIIIIPLVKNSCSYAPFNKKKIQQQKIIEESTYTDSIDIELVENKIISFIEANKKQNEYDMDSSFTYVESSNNINLDIEQIEIKIKNSPNQNIRELSSECTYADNLEFSENDIVELENKIISYLDKRKICANVIIVPELNHEICGTNNLSMNN